jgi:hypothetical protein
LLLSRYVLREECRAELALSPCGDQDLTMGAGIVFKFGYIKHGLLEVVLYLFKISLLNPWFIDPFPNFIFNYLDHLPKLFSIITERKGYT